jgi:predicted metal-dependent hydrolase
MIKFNLNISETEIPVTVEKHSRFRRCSMRVNSNGLRLTVPLSYQAHEWRAFIDKHRPWIRRTFSKHQTAQDKLPKLEEGAKIPFRGNFYTVTSSDKYNGSSTPIDSINFIEELAIVPSYLLKEDSADRFVTELVNLYLSESDKLLRTLIDKWRSHLQGNISKISLKEMKSRWGSCSSKGTIALNWRLIMAPDEVFEYVFVHELCHIEIQAHNSKFWQHVEHKFPGAAIWRRLLKKNNHMLMNFPFPVNSSKNLRNIIL